MTCEKKTESSAEVHSSKVTPTEKTLDNLLLTEILHVVHVFKLREGIHFFLGNIFHVWNF